MAYLNTPPFSGEVTPVAPAARFQGRTGSLYTHRLGGARLHAKLRYMNLPEETNFRLLRRDITKLLVDASAADDPFPETLAAFNSRLAGNGYIWVDFRKINVPVRTNSPRSVTAVAGARITLNASPPSTVLGEYVCLGGQPALVQDIAGSVITVWPRPVHSIAIGSHVFDPNAGPLGQASRAAYAIDPGPIGMWCTLPGDPPSWVHNPAAKPYGSPLNLDLQGDI